MVKFYSATMRDIRQLGTILGLRFSPWCSLGTVRKYGAYMKMDSRYVKTKHESTYGFTRRAKDAWSKQDIADLPSELRPDHAETLDLILRKRIYLVQSRRGYRANTDSQLVAYFACQRLSRSFEPLRVLDLGAGNGLISVLFGRAYGADACRLWLVELQGQLAERARRNLSLNDVRGVVHRHDIAHGLPPHLAGQMDVVLMNPPFYQMHSRTPPRRREKLLAHMETSANITAFCTAASMALVSDSPSARVFIVYDVREVHRLYVALRMAKMKVVAAQEVQHRAEEPASRVLVEAMLCKQVAESDENAFCDSCLLPKLCLHPPGTNLYEYDETMERFLDSLPPPRLRIGQLR